MRIDEKNGEKEMLEEARRLIDGEAATSAQISEGAKIVRNLAENGDCIETKTNHTDETDDGFYDKRAAKDDQAIFEMLIGHEK